MNKPSLTFQAFNVKNISGQILLAAGLVGAGIAQWTLILSFQSTEFWQVKNWLANFSNNTSPLPGLLLYLISSWIFIQGWLKSEHKTTKFNIHTIELQSHSPKFGFWITCLGLSVLTGGFAASSSANLNGVALTITWILNITLLIISTLIEIRWSPPSLKKIKKWLNTHLPELLTILLIIIVAFIVRFWDLELYPYSFINDEGQMGNSGVCIIQGPCTNIFDIGWAAQPMLAFVPTGISVSLLGRTALAVRLVSVIIGCLAVLAVYLFTREAFGKREAWIAMALLATLPVHVHFSRIGVDNIIDSLSTTALLGLLFMGIKRGSVLIFLFAGILGGVCIYTYPGSRLAPMLALGTLGCLVLQKHSFLKNNLQRIVIFLLSLIVTAAPIGGYFLVNPTTFASRMGTEGIFQNHSYEGLLQAGANPVELLIGQFMKSFLVFFVTNAPSGFYNSPKPYLTYLAAVFFSLGFAYMLWRIKEVRYFVLFIWFFSAIILGSTLTGGPPSSQRMLMSMPALAVITAIGISRFMENLNKDHISLRLQPAAILLVVIWIGYMDISFYHFEYRTGHYFEDPTNEFTYETAAIISPLHEHGRLYLITDPSTPYLDFPNFDYFSPDVKKQYFPEITEVSLTSIQKDKDALFIATPDRLGDLKKLANLLPGGEWNEFKRRYQQPNMLYYSYLIKKSVLQAIHP